MKTKQQKFENVNIHWTDTKCGLRLALFFYVSFSQSLIPVRLMCFWPIVKVWYQGWRNEILYSLYKLQLNALGSYMSGEKCFLHIPHSKDVPTSEPILFQFFQAQMSFVQFKICLIFDTLSFYNYEYLNKGHLPILLPRLVLWLT